MIRDRIVLSVCDKSIHNKKIFYEKKFDYQKRIYICRDNEKTSLQLKNIDEVKYVKSKLLKERHQPKKDKGHWVIGTHGGEPKYDDD